MKIIFAPILSALIISGVAVAGNPAGEPSVDLERLWRAVCAVESGSNANIKNGDGGEAVGIVQMHRCAVDDANRIIRLHGQSDRFTYSDRRNVEKAHEMFLIIQRHYAADWTRRHSTAATVRVYAAIWHTPGKIDSELTSDYASRVVAEYERTE